jgi:hypothetical protein
MSSQKIQKGKKVSFRFMLGQLRVKMQGVIEKNYIIKKEAIVKTKIGNSFIVSYSPTIRIKGVL